MTHKFFSVDGLSIEQWKATADCMHNLNLGGEF